MLCSAPGLISSRSGLLSSASGKLCSATGLISLSPVFGVPLLVHMWSMFCPLGYHSRPMVSAGWSENYGNAVLGG
eukprot:7190092-Pyramimonas_sp.AAC.1